MRKFWRAPRLRRSVITAGLALAAGAAPAAAQPAPDPTVAPAPDPAPPPAPAPPPTPTPTPEPPGAPRAVPVDDWLPDDRTGVVAAPTPAPTSAPTRRSFDAPDILLAPTGRLLPAGVVYSRTLLDTSGGFASDLRVGLGDVAEFGVATTDLFRARRRADDRPERVAPYPTATFRMGVAEDRLFAGMPALALGFRKSFERNVDGHATRIAELHLVGSKRLGADTVVHAGAVFWDASLTPDGQPAILLHDDGLGRQLRAVGGVELRPFDDAQVLVDLAWIPEVCYECATRQINLTAILSWGVRYEVAPWLRLESGVRLPDIDRANLLDAQIFGQVVMVSRRLAALVER